MYQHNSTGLNLTWYRAYNPQIGRWISKDPIEESGGLNLYGYVGGRPLDYIDPTGEFGLAGAFGGALFSTVMQFGLNFYATDFDVKRSLLCLDLADIAISAALGASGPTLIGDIGLNVLRSKAAQYAKILTRRQAYAERSVIAKNAQTYTTKLLPTSIMTKKNLKFTVDDLRKKISDAKCDDAKCDEISSSKKLNFLKLLQY